MNVNTSLSGNKVRSSNLELYRIVCMLAIVAHHFVVNSGLVSPDGPVYMYPSNIKSILLDVVGMWGKTGINCFVFITGYFMCTSSITLRKFIKLMLQIYLYKIVIFTILLVAGYESLSILRVVKLIMPIWGLNSNFTSCFIVFWLTIPFWNILIKNLNRLQHGLLLLLFLFTYTLLGSIPGFEVSLNYVGWFGILYIVASYIRLYPYKIYSNKLLWFTLTITFIILAVFSILVLNHYFGFRRAYYFVSDSNKFFAFAVAFCSFMWFKNICITNSRFINAVGGSTFGVLLIHASSDAMRTWLWRDTIDCVGHYNLPTLQLLLYCLGSVFLIFIVCIIIDRIRIHFIEEPILAYYDRRRGKRIS